MAKQQLDDAPKRQPVAAVGAKKLTKPAGKSRTSAKQPSGGTKAAAKAPATKKRAAAKAPATKKQKTAAKAPTKKQVAAKAPTKKQTAAKAPASKKQQTAAKAPAGEQSKREPVAVANATSGASTKGTSRAVKTKTPTPEQQRLQDANRKLWEAYAVARAPELREQIILQYAPLVKYVMGRLAISLPAVLDYEDILSFGTIGLIEAVERFDYEKGVKFETYAISRIRGAIIDALRSLDRLPRSVRQKAKDADKALVDLTSDLGRDPTDEEVAEAMGLKIEAYRKHLVDASWITVSLDTMGMSHDGEEDSGGALGIADPDEENFDSGLEQQELIGELAGAIRELPEREQLILSLYYKEELTMREVSKVLDISESRVCQLHARALTRLRGSIARMQEGRAA